jgi:aspartate ammonia-lyase
MSRTEHDLLGANVDHMRAMVDRSIGLVTALNPHLGYEAATRLAAEALESGSDVAALVRDRGLLTASQLATILAPVNLPAATERSEPLVGAIDDFAADHREKRS